MSDLGKRLLFALGLTAAADALLFATAPGAGLTLFGMLTALVLATRYAEKLPRARGWLVLWSVLLLNTAWTHSLIGILLLIALTWVVLALALIAQQSTFFTGVLRGITGGARSFILLGSDLRRYVLITNRLLAQRSTREGGLFKFLPPIWVYALPTALILVFALLIIPANLVLAEWTGEIFTTLWDFCTTLFLKIDLARCLFWLILGLGLYGLIRFRLGRHPGHHARRIREIRRELLLPEYRNLDDAPPEPADPRHELQACLITVGGLNLLYALANLTDLFYIWLHFELPAGMTYAQFAHHGSYRLIVAVILAAILIPAFFRIGAAAATHSRARLLAYAFVAQNLIVLLGAARRLMIYDEVYGLSRFRLSTYLWLALVFTGFVLIAIKIAHEKPFRFLLETNAIATVLLLTTVGWLNLDGFIANWNVNRYLSGKTKEMDVRYLSELDSGALPALNRLTKATDPDIAQAAKSTLGRRLIEEKSLQHDWRNWTYRRATDIHSAEYSSSP